jgi:hypothetical protein
VPELLEEVPQRQLQTGRQTNDRDQLRQNSEGPNSCGFKEHNYLWKGSAEATEARHMDGERDALAPDKPESVAAVGVAQLGTDQGVVRIVGRLLSTALKQN